MLTLITVNYNCAGRTVELLRSLQAQTDPKFSVIVVENDSAPEDRTLLGEFAATSPLTLDLILSPRNLGYAGGNNLALRKALRMGADWFLLINPDTVVAPDFIMALRRQLDPARPLCALPLDEGTRVAYAGKVRWLAATFPHVYRPVTAPDPSLYIIGAGLVAHRSVFERTGLPDERYFLYFEDADFALRARKAGFSPTFLSGPPVRHSVMQSTSRLGTPLLLRYHIRNALEFNRIHGPWWVKISLHFWAFFAILKQLVKVLLLPARRPQSRAIAAGIVDFYARRFGYIKPQTSGPRR